MTTASTSEHEKNINSHAGREISIGSATLDVEGVNNDTVMDAYGSIVENYFEHKTDQRSPSNLIDKPALRDLLNGDMEGRVVLDAGGGTGWATDIILQEVNPKSVHLVDFSLPMMDKARETIQDDRVSFVLNSLDNIDLPDDSVHMIVASYSMDCVVNLRETLTEFTRVLIPEGRLVMLIKHPERNRLYADRGGFELEEGYNTWVWENWDGTGDQPVPRRYMSQTQWNQEILHAGFSNPWPHDPKVTSIVRQLAPDIWNEYAFRKSSLIISAVNGGSGNLPL